MDVTMPIYPAQSVLHFIFCVILCGSASMIFKILPAAQEAGGTCGSTCRMDTIILICMQQYKHVHVNSVEEHRHALWRSTIAVA